MKAYLFVGPTAANLISHAEKLKQYHVLAPCKRGDVSSLTERKTETKRIIIVDGVFMHYPAVGHAEILSALNLGWEVIGLSSMGAIRAYEMSKFGMKGFGAVYKTFCDFEDLMDDEVALYHGPAPDYINISQALIELRYFLNNSALNDLLAENEKKHIIKELKNTHYGKRTLQRLRELILSVKNLNSQQLDKIFEDYSNYKIKQIDLINFLKND